MSVMCVVTAAGGSSSIVTIVGSVNADVYVPVSRWPEDGENIVADESEMSGVTLAGGKGAIQAVACSMMMANTPCSSRFVAQFGSDANGKMLKDVIEGYGVDLSLSAENVKPSGCGIVFLKETGSVSAIVIGAANANWPETIDVEEILPIEDGRGSAAVMLQMEIPQRVNALVARAAKARGIPVFQDVGGAERSLEELGQEYLALCDYISPNETELKRLTKMPVGTDEEVVAAAKFLQRRGANNVLVTLGSRGALLLTKEGDVIRQECFPVKKVRDETGAGDNFRAAFVVSHFVDGKTLRQSLEYAAASAALSVGKVGGIPSCTSRDECDRAVALRHRGGHSPSPASSGHEDVVSAEDEAAIDECPLQFASRLNSMKDREAVLSLPSSGVVGWVLQQGLVAGLGLVDFNYPQHLSGPLAQCEDEKTALLAALDSAGLKCGAVCLRFPRHLQAGAMTHPDPALREEAARLVEQACEWATALGSREVVVWSAFCGYDYSLQADYAVLWNRVKLAFQRACDRYPSCKISLEFKPSDENTRYFAVPSTAAAVLLVREVDRANFGLVLDLGHTLMAGENPAQSVAMVHSLAGEGKLFGVQLGDGPARPGEDGLCFGSVHESAAFEFVYWLRKTGFDRHGGHVYFDTFPRNEDARREAEYNIRQFKSFWAKAGRWLRDPRIQQIRERQDAMGLLEYQEQERERDQHRE